MGTSSDLWKDGNIRGDKILWFSECLPGREKSSISQVVRKIECKLRRDLGMEDTKAFPLSAQLSVFDAGMQAVALASYPHISLTMTPVLFSTFHE